MHGKVTPSSNGLLRALQALAEESMLLGLKHTHLALRHAINTCLVEGGEPATANQVPVTAQVVH
jgi:hypothetical protein